MTRDLIVGLGCAFLAGVSVGVEYMNVVGMRAKGNANAEASVPSTPARLIPAAPMPRAPGFEERPELTRLTLPVRCVRLPGIEGMGREWLRSWGDSALPPALPTCVNASYKRMRK